MQTFALFPFFLNARNSKQRYVGTNLGEHGKPFSPPQIRIRPKTDRPTVEASFYSFVRTLVYHRTNLQQHIII